MSIFDDAVSLTQDVFSILGDGDEDDPVLLYPVRASEVAAWLSISGNEPVDLSGKGVIDFATIQYEDGEVAVDTTRGTFSTDEQTVADSGIVRDACSIRHGGELYDVVRIRPIHPGGRDCYLRKYGG